MTSERDLINQMEYKKKEGIEIGEERGIEKNKLATAKKMLSKNYSIDEISDITGLSKESLEDISEITGLSVERLKSLE